jgi:arsenate reductase
MSRRVFNILFLCSGNSARSIIAEAYLNGLKQPHLRAFSAGSAPLGKINSFALKILQEADIATEGLRSKSWDEFSSPDAPKMDMVINLCEDPNKDPCPTWPGKPALANWAVPDPVIVEGNDAKKRAAFAHVLAYIKQRTGFLQHFDEAQLANLSTHVGGFAKGDAMKSGTTFEKMPRR